MGVIYGDSVTGNDANPGTEALPKATPRGVVAAAADNDTVLFARDRFYEPYLGFFPIIRKKNLTIGAYGTGERPCFDGMTYEVATATGWTHEGSGIWSKTFANALVRRLWVGSTNTGKMRGQRTHGTAMRRAKTSTGNTLPGIMANLNADDIWWSSNATLGWRLFIYTGSTTIAPPQFYGGLSFIQADGATTGAFAAVNVQGPSENILVMSIESWGSGQYSFAVRSNTTDAGPVRNVMFYDCVARYMYTGAFQIQPVAENNTNPRTEISGVIVDQWYADSMTAPQEQEPSRDYGNLGGAMDMAVMYDAVKNCEIRNGVSKNCFHVSFSLGAYNFNSQLPDNCGFRRNRMVSDAWHTYTRGATTYNCLENCYVVDNEFDGQNVRSQFAGGALIANNRWINLRTSARISGVSQVMNIAVLITDRGYTNVGDERYVRTFPNNLRIYSNIFVDPPADPIQIETFDAADYNYPVATPVIGDGAVHILNNIGYDRLRAAGAPWYWVFSRATQIGTQDVRNNAIYTGSGKAAATASINNVTMAINAAPGCRSNITDDPMVDMTDPTKLVLGAASPCRTMGAFIGAQDADAFSSLPDTIGPFGNTPTIALG